MLAKLQSRYTAPQPPQPPPPAAPSIKPAQTPTPPQPALTEQAATSPQAAAETITQVVAASLIEAEAAGVAQAATAAEAAPQPSPTAKPPEEPPATGKFEEGRFLPKTPDNSPWLARYVRPSHAGSVDGADVPSIYYGKLLKPGGLRGSSGSMKSTSQRLKDLGVNPASLPLNDAKAMRAVQAGIRRFERAGRVVGAKQGAWQYRSRKLSESEIAQFRAEVEAEAAKELEAESEGPDQYDIESSYRTTMRRGFPTGTDTSRAPGSGGGGGGMTLRRWTSVADERIEAARAAGLFKENKLRGKPLEAEIHERNPYLGHEERLMNRMIKKQGASPPWVELNNTFHSHLGAFRSKLVDTFSRRAVRSLTQSGALLSSGGPGTGTAGGTEEQRRAYFVALAQGYRDAEWERSERGYHEESVKDLNETLRRYNSIAPPSARKSPVVRENELVRCYEASTEVIADGLNEAWLEVTGQKVRPDLSGGLFSGGPVTYDIWGRPMDQRDAGAGNGRGGGWSLSSLFSRDNPAALERSNVGGDGDKEDGIRNRSDNDASPSIRGASQDGVGLITRIKQWLASDSNNSNRDNKSDEARRQ